MVRLVAIAIYTPGVTRVSGCGMDAVTLPIILLQRACGTSPRRYQGDRLMEMATKTLPQAEILRQVSPKIN